MLFHTQLGELADLARAFPQTTMVLNHVGCPIGLGPYAERKAEIFSAWRTGIKDLAKHENVVVKLGGIGMHVFGFGLDKRPEPPLSAELAETLATLLRGVPRRLRAKARDVREQFSGRQDFVQL